MEDQNPTKKFQPTVSTAKVTFSVITAFSIRNNNFLWTCHSSTDCCSLICSTKTEQNFPFTCQSQGGEAKFQLAFKLQLECQVLRQFPLRLPSLAGQTASTLTNSSTNEAEQRPNLATRLSSPYPYWQQREKRMALPWNMVGTGKLFHLPHLLLSSLRATWSSFYKHRSKPPNTHMWVVTKNI